MPDKSNQHDATDEPRFDLKTTTHVVTAGIHFKEYEKCWDSNNADDPYRQTAETDTNPSNKTCVVVSVSRRARVRRRAVEGRSIAEMR